MDKYINTSILWCIGMSDFSILKFSCVGDEFGILRTMMTRLKLEVKKGFEAKEVAVVALLVPISRSSRKWKSFPGTQLRSSQADQNPPQASFQFQCQGSRLSGNSFGQSIWISFSSKTSLTRVFLQVYQNVSGSSGCSNDDVGRLVMLAAPKPEIPPVKKSWVADPWEIWWDYPPRAPWG